jgi:N-formylglutamate amidohydrolase
MIPPGERARLALTDEKLERELLVMTDAWTEELFSGAAPQATRVVFPVSRLVCDPERFPRDADEPMSRVGMGAVYSRTSGGEVLRAALSEEDRQRILTTYYLPHNEALTRATENALPEYGRVLIVDCHSFPARPLPYELDQASDRPDVCIGTDPYHTPPGIAETALHAVRSLGWSVMENWPFAGALVPLAFYRRDPRVHAIMIEVNRGLYMNELTGERSSGFNVVRAGLERMLVALAEFFEAGF